MATALDLWEKDPFFYAAEDVQESADRLESVYRLWIMHDKKQIDGVADLSVAELRRELNAALGTAKWQLEDLERAVRFSDRGLSAGEATVTRHNDFIEAISCKIWTVENALRVLNREKVVHSALSWVSLDEGERHELALFLSRPKSEMENVLPTMSEGFHVAGNIMNSNSSVCFSNPCASNVSNPLEMMVDKMKGHQRVASASADLGILKISVSTELSPLKLSTQEHNLPLKRIHSFSELQTVEASSKPKWYMHGFKKWKVLSHDNMEESMPLRNHHVQDMSACYEKSKRCLRYCTDESYSKHINGWFVSFVRQIQRSQYQIQYGQPVQIIVWAFVIILLVGILMCELSGR